MDSNKYESRQYIGVRVRKRLIEKDRINIACNWMRRNVQKVNAILADTA